MPHVPMLSLFSPLFRAPLNLRPFVYELHINRASRQKYQVDGSLIESSGNVLLPNFRIVRELAHAINTARAAAGIPAQEVRAGFLNAVGLLDEIGHFLIRMYDEIENPGAVRRAVSHIRTVLGVERVDALLLQFVTDFPPKAVYDGYQTEKQYLASSTAGRDHVEIVLEELVMLHLSNINPVNRIIRELFDDTALIARTPYIAAMKELESFFEKEKPFGPDRQPLLTALKKPIFEHPDNIEAQLGYLREKWGIVLSAKFIDRIASGFALSKEEETFLWNTFHRHGGPPVVETFVPEYKKGGRPLTASEQRELERRGLVRPEDHIYAEPERFTPDTDWMPNVVLIAKNTYVWLDQLSKQYRREIKRLDQIPDEELDQLARWNYTGLWLIGVWERSVASKRIKQINGNLDAVSSAYSLYDYEIAQDIGGEAAYQDLNRRCWARGIRLAGDMVPNHMGIYSKWVLEHPEFFIHSDRPPYPNYRFTGENLSHDPNIELRIEDGYWSRSDAAVVFQRIDRRTGNIQYVYHGNDGTSMPWNDTAQLNLLRADVREAVIQSIFHVARKFSIIRFDAAMTLAKKHFQRLWYPMPGTVGVPSRQDHSLSRAEFDALFPNEFWREVVDRFNAEMPQTLLLAEAFWLMEGYFVRTLGMHRVYNSAFMHMLMKEENQKFRAMIRNTIEFTPEILKRYVNFMSNPDEQTAVEQFGKDDKYFGVATLMVTLPGLPMFAHGQIEGYREKYGMEYQRAYYHESPDEWLVRRHEHEIFPLTKKRYLFSQVEHFELYDFITEQGGVNENVIAYSNRAGDERVVVLFHNTFAETRGNIRTSAPRAAGADGNTRTVTLAESLGIRNEWNILYRFRERKSNKEFLVTGERLHQRGLTAELRAFEYAVYMDFREIADEQGAFRAIVERLNGAGVHGLDDMLKEVTVRPFHDALRNVFVNGDAITPTQLHALFAAAVHHAGAQLDIGESVLSANVVIEQVLKRTREQITAPRTSKGMKQEAVISPMEMPLREKLIFILLSVLRTGFTQKNERNVPDIVRDLVMTDVLTEVLGTSEGKYGSFTDAINDLRCLLRLREGIAAPGITLRDVVERLFNDFEGADLLGVNEHNGVWYFNQERFTRMAVRIAGVRMIYRSLPDRISDEDEFLRLERAASRSGFVVEQMKEYLVESSEPIKRQKKLTKTGNKKSTTVKKKTKSVAVKKKIVKNITRKKKSR